MLHALPLSRSLPHHSHRLRNPERIVQVASRGLECSGQQHDLTTVDRSRPVSILSDVAIIRLRQALRRA